VIGDTHRDVECLGEVRDGVEVHLFWWTWVGGGTLHESEVLDTSLAEGADGLLNLTWKNTALLH